MMGGLTCGGLGILLTAGAPHRVAIAAAMLLGQQIITDPGWAVYDINHTSLRQAIAPEGALGRVTAAEHFGGLVAMLIATIVAGIAADVAGARVVLVLGACCLFAGALVILASPLRHAAAA